MDPGLPIPAPPRTPTPPTPIPEDDPSGLRISGMPQFVNSTISYDANSLSPMSGMFPGRFGSMDSAMPSPATGSLNSDGTMGPPPSTGVPKSPFNFQTQTYSVSSPVTKSVSKLFFLVFHI